MGKTFFAAFVAVASPIIAAATPVHGLSFGGNASTNPTHASNSTEGVSVASNSTTDLWGSSLASANLSPPNNIPKIQVETISSEPSDSFGAIDFQSWQEGGDVLVSSSSIASVDTGLGIEVDRDTILGRFSIGGYSRFYLSDNESSKPSLTSLSNLATHSSKIGMQTFSPSLMRVNSEGITSFQREAISLLVGLSSGLCGGAFGGICGGMFIARKLRYYV
ncbi:MAG: hypothetical protein ACK456_04490 [Pseudanabaenaceae cyanobacterium]|jgi:hypothetical protein